MKKFSKSLMLLAFAATAVCGLVFSGINPNKPDSTFAEPKTAPSTTYPIVSPDVYYQNFDDSGSETTLLNALRTFNMANRKSNISYESLDSYYCYTDYDPATVQYDSKNQPYGTRILSFYSGKSTTSYNKEHVWPNSRGGGSKKGKSGSPYVEDDIFMPRPTISEENQDRGNSSYVEGMNHTANGWDPVTAFASNIGVYESIRGESARIIFYCMTVNPNLRLVDDANTDFAGVGGRVTMGKLSDMLRWHLTNPVNEREINRNNGGQYLQGNRNAFVDHRSYACKIWGNTNSTTKSICNQYNGWTEEDPSKTLTKIEVTQQPSKKTYNEGESFDKTGLVVTAIYSTGNTENVTSKVTVSPDPLTVGTTSVTLSYKYGSDTKTAVVSGITVNPVTPVTSVTINNTKKDFYINETCTLDTTVLPTNATNKTLTYTTSKSDVATVDSSGKVSFKAAGSATITAKSNNNKTASITFNVTKQPVPVTGIEASLPSSSYYVGDTANIQYTVKPTNADNKSVLFSSSDESIASVNNAGLVTFKSTGDVTITVKSAENQSFSVGINISVSERPVVDVPVDSVTFDSCKTNVEVGETVQLFANISPENATNKNLTYSSSDTAVAEVNSSGLVSFKECGSVTITAKSHNNKTATKTFTVGSEPKPESKLVEIAVSNKPDKLVYSIGEVFDESGLEIEEHYLDGSSVVIPRSEYSFTAPDTSTAGNKKVSILYKETFTTEFEIVVVEGAVSNLKIEKYPAKTHYFVSEEFSPIGLKVTAKFGEEVRDVTNLVSCEYNFALSPKVKIIFKNLFLNLTITVEEGEMSNEHKAADFAYVVEENVMNIPVNDVTINDWNVLEHYYNKLDDGAKEVLKNTVTKYSGGTADAAEELSETLKECAAKYDEIYLAHEADGFNDFMGREPKAQTNKSNSGLDTKTILILVGIAVAVVVLVTVIIIVAVKASKKGKKQHG